MEEAEFVADSPSIQSFIEWNDMCIEDGGDENFSAFLSSYLKSCKCSSEAKIQFLDEFAKDIERELKALEDQEIPQIPSFQSLPCEVLFQQKQNDTWLPFPFDIGDQQTNFDKYVFYDPVAEYMEIFFSLNFSHVFIVRNKSIINCLCYYISYFHFVQAWSRSQIIELVT
jgi:hypothetical protein